MLLEHVQPFILFQYINLYFFCQENFPNKKIQQLEKRYSCCIYQILRIEIFAMIPAVSAQAPLRKYWLLLFHWPKLIVPPKLPKRFAFLMPLVFLAQVRY